jgi:hypothetical protein
MRWITRRIVALTAFLVAVVGFLAAFGDLPKGLDDACTAVSLCKVAETPPPYAAISADEFLAAPFGVEGFRRYGAYGRTQ